MSGLQRLSLKGRFLWVFLGLLMLAVGFCSLLLWEQHRAAVLGAELAISAQSQIVAATRMREALLEADRLALVGEMPSLQLAKFRELKSRVLAAPALDEALNRAFESYAGELTSVVVSNASPQIRRRYGEALAEVDHVLENTENSTYLKAKELQDDQQRSIRASLGFLAGFIFLMVLASYLIIAVITRPLSALVHFLDGVSVEDDLPSEVPELKSQIPELRRVVNSFDELLGRLRGYRALNVRRLLIEKRRADIIAASISDGVFLLRDLEILYVNAVGERILGTSIGKSLDLVKHEHSLGPQAILSAVSRTMPVEFKLEDEFRVAHYLIQAYPIAGDVIERAEHSVGPVEELLERFQANVIVVATDVTLVCESQEAKRHFLGTLSHEVKTPVTSLTMATRLLKRDLDRFENPTHRSLISTCIDDVERLRGLLEDLLTVSRFETIAQRLELQTIDLAKLVRHAVQSYQAEARERGIELVAQVLNPSSRPLLLPVDATKISWALSNLIVNALRHTPPRGKVQAQIEAYDDAIEVRVRDTGPGIERRRQERIFDKFNPYYDLRVARSGGAGVGLAIAREIILAHGGRIWVSSEPGEGAEFAFRLPMKKLGTVPGALSGSLTGRSQNSMDGSLKGDNRGTSTGSG